MLHRLRLRLGVWLAHNCEIKFKTNHITLDRSNLREFHVRSGWIATSYIDRTQHGGYLVS